MFFSTPKLKDIPNIFDFEYEFYSDDTNIKSNFEDLFKRRYAYRHIAFDDIDEFKHYLKYKLDEIAPLYKQYYDSEIRAKDIEFLLNKDYKETFKKVNNTENSRDEIANKDTTIDNSLEVVNKGSDLSTNTTDLKTINNTNINANNTTNTDRNSIDTTDSTVSNNTNNSVYDHSNKSGGTTDRGTSTDTLTKDSTNKTSNVADGVADPSLSNGLTGISTDIGKDVNNNVYDKSTSYTDITTANNRGESSSKDITKGTNTNTLKDTTKQSGNTTEYNNSSSTGLNKTSTNTEGKSTTKGLSNTISKEGLSIKDLLKGSEEYELVGRGNIGTTSSAQLLIEWRNSMLNLNKMVLEELADLFILLY